MRSRSRKKRRYLWAGLLVWAYLAAGVSAAAEVPSGDGQAEETETVMEKSFPAEGRYVKLIGRTRQEDGILWLAHSASGVEFRIRAASLRFDLTGDMAAAQKSGYNARYAVFLDGEKVLDEMMDQPEKQTVVFEGDQERDVTVKLLKLSEASESGLGIRAIEAATAGEPSPTEEKQLKIEFIGDSITCGYGVDERDPEVHFSTETEDASKAWAYLAAGLLDADYSIVACSGHGILSGYTGDGTQNTANLIPPVYEQFAKTYGRNEGFFSEDAPWDFSSFVPDFIVINLGTNDSTYTGSDPEKTAAFAAEYLSFLKMLRKDNPDAHIICSLGIMGDLLLPAVEKAAEEYTQETGDENLSVLRLSGMKSENGFGADYHPSEITQQIAAEELAAYIRSLLQR